MLGLRKSKRAAHYRSLLRLLSRMRISAQISQSDLAKRMGTSQAMVSKLEHGVVRMDITYLLDYLHGIEADPVAFMSEFMQIVDGTRDPV